MPTTDAATDPVSTGSDVALRLVALPPLMDLTSGIPDVTIGLLDGPVATRHPDLVDVPTRVLPGASGGEDKPDGAAYRHGTFVAGVIAARRGAPAPAIAPDCTLLLCPVFSRPAESDAPGAVSASNLAAAIVGCVDAGAWILNLSAAVRGVATDAAGDLDGALTYAARRGVLVVAAAGNDGLLASSPLTSHPWVLPVTGCTLSGQPRARSRLGRSVGTRGLAAPAEGVTSLSSDENAGVPVGTSVAAPFVTGAAALLWSSFPEAAAADVKGALIRAVARPRRSVAPPLLDAWRAFQFLSRTRRSVR